MSTAVVVGGGPNGLAAAIALAAEGVSVTVLEAADEVGGGARSSEAILPGLLHDHCSAIHPMAVGSPFLSKFNLARYGLTWLWPEVDCVHPLDGGSAGVLHRSVEQTAAGLGRDGSRWQRAFGYPASRFDALNEDIMGPLLRIPHHPLMLARFGAPTVLSGVHVRQGVPHRGGPCPVRRRCGPCLPAAALPDDLGDRDGHHLGRAPARLGGGRRRIAVDHQRDGCAADRPGRQDRDGCPGREGVAAATGRRHDVRSGAGAVAGILGDRLPRRISRAFNKFRRGPGAFKVDFAVDGGVPWTNPDARRAGTVHVVGNYRELAATERDIHAGRMPERPFVLVGQQYLADPQRSVGDVHPVWTYAHVPNGSSATQPRRSLLRSSGSRPASGIGSSGRPSGPPPNSLPTTPTTSAATS